MRNILGKALLLVDKFGRKVKFDVGFKALLVQQIPHERIHTGKFFRFCAFVDDLDTSEHLILAFKTPNTAERIHLVPVNDSSGSALWNLLEAPTITADTGTVQPIFNRKRESDVASAVFDMQVVPVVGQGTRNPTITADGTVICQWLIGVTGLGNRLSPGGNREEEEWLLKPNTTYAFRITAQADDLRVNLALNYYEKIPG